MPSFKEFLTEASLGRFYQHLSGFKDGEQKVIAILTASRASATKAENKANNAMLRKYIKMATYGGATPEEKIGFIKVEGHYMETQPDGTSKPVKEDSTVIIAPRSKAETVKKLAMSLGAKFNQDSIFYAKDGNGMLIYTRDIKNENGEIDHHKGDVIPLGQFRPQELGLAFTKIRGKTFAFDWIGESIEYGSPKNFNEAQLFEGFVKVLEHKDNPIEFWEKVTQAE